MRKLNFFYLPFLFYLFNQTKFLKRRGRFSTPPFITVFTEKVKINIIYSLAVKLPILNPFYLGGHSLRKRIILRSALTIRPV